MNLTPREKDKLLVAMAAMVARRRLERRVRLNYPEAIALISDFVARKIRSRVKDPKVAEKLIPKNHGFGTRRVPLETRYFEVYNQPNVELVDLTETPIERVTPTGIRTSERDYDFDMIIYATGFDALTGAFDRIDFRGVDGRKLKDEWAEGAETFVGMSVQGFPNMLILWGKTCESPLIGGVHE